MIQNLQDIQTVARDAVRNGCLMRNIVMVVRDSEFGTGGTIKQNTGSSATAATTAESRTRRVLITRTVAHSKMNYYFIETYVGDDVLNPWVKIKQGSKQYCQGWLDAMKDHSPRRHMQLCRGDGKIIEEVAYRSDVWIGQIAGWPTAEQYERAAQEALEKAKHIRARVALKSNEQ